MICKNCGGEFDGSLLRCPYCGFQNEKTAKKQKKEILKKYDEEAKAIEAEANQYTKKRTAQITRNIFAIIGAVAVVSVLVAVLYFLFIRKMDEKAYGVVEKHENTLDELMENRDYEGMIDYAEKYDINLAYYEKHQQVIVMYRNYDSVRSHEENLYMYAGHMKQGDEEHQADNKERWTFNVEVALTRILYDGAAVVRDYNRYGLDDVFLGNEENLKEMYTFSTTVFNLAGFTEEEIQELALGEKSPIWDDLYQKLLDYYWEEIM